MNTTMTDTANDKSLPTSQFGASARSVTRVGLGGEGVLRTFGEEVAAQAVIEEALNQGITYFDTARAYAGSENYLGSVWEKRPEDRKRIFHTGKSARRDAKGALEDLQTTLTNLRTDYLDLWQIHDVRTKEDFEAISAPGGALEAFVEAKRQGKVKHIGVTGHHAPNILTRCVGEWPVDSVLLPVNIVEGALGGFMTETLPVAREKGAAVIGMKVFGGGRYIYPQGNVTPQLLLRYALSQPVTSVIVGCSIPDHVRILGRIARDFAPIPPEAQEELLASFRPHADRLAYYRGVI